MNYCFLNLLLSFQALLPLDGGVNLLGYVAPVGSFGVGLFIIVFVYLVVEYNIQLLSHEKFKIAINILHTTHTPLILLRNQLKELKTGNLPEPISQKIEEALGYTESIIYCNQNVATLGKVNGKIKPKTSTVNLELSTYITSIVNRCRPYANSRQIRLTVNECSDCVSCKINESIMTAALQHLLNRMILITGSGSCISINITRIMNTWNLQISNCEAEGKGTEKMFPFIPVMFPMYGYSDLWTVRKIIRLHGGRITGYGHGKAVTFQISIPTECHCQNKECPVMKQSSASTKNNSQPKDTPNILLVMTDKLFSNYLKKSLSRYFQVSVLEDPGQVMNTAIRQNPDAIIIDDNVNGISGDSLCFQIKANKSIGNMPVVLLTRSFDNESYLSHLGSGADRLELRAESICKLRADIRMLIENHMILRERIKLFLSDVIPPISPMKAETKNENQIFMDNVNEILERNLATEKYTIDRLSADVGMSRTAFYSKMKEIIGRTPEDYVYAYKMEKALKLLASQQFSISEIAYMLGYCDSKYFGKKFKGFYHICPTDYIKKIVG